MHETVRFWLDRGIDGFRLDVINFISKDQRFPDSAKGVLSGSEYYSAGPRLHEYLKELGSILKEYNAFSVGEMPCVNDPQEIIKSVRSDRGELNMIFHFELYGFLAPSTFLKCCCANISAGWISIMDRKGSSHPVSGLWEN